MTSYQNPIIRGFNPDPSICRVGEDYYLVTSTFEFFPGVPIYHSKNLVDWELINYCLTRDSQLNLVNARCSGGIYAPTIRYHDGWFYMITTNVSDRGSFIVYTDDIYGEWSDPQWVEHEGIDPSLFFDDDGTVYFCGRDNNSGGIILYEINPRTGKKLSATQIISYGTGGKHPEAPHIYKVNNYYYLLLAEGGTEYGHMATILRSKSPYGPYEACPHNPILTHRDFTASPIQATGHADLIEDTNGNWWLVCLGIRPLPGLLLHNLGRETFLTPMVWDENGWPVVGNKGTIAMTMEGPLPAPIGFPPSLAAFEDDFTGPTLKKEWTFVRNPRRENYSLSTRKGYLKLTAGAESLSDPRPTFLGIRQQEFAMRAQTQVLLNSMSEGQKAGLAAFYNQNYHYALYVTREQGRSFVVLAKKVHDLEDTTTRVEIDFDGMIEFQIETGSEDYHFRYRLDGDWIEIGTGKTAGLCTEGTMTMTFTGTFLGLFASKGEAFFKYFRVQALNRAQNNSVVNR